MELNDLIAKQIGADRRRGFKVDFDDEKDKIDQIEKDLIGLFGEVGEFANLIKKVRLKIDHHGYKGPTLIEANAELRDELADIAIYVFRLSVILDGNLETDLVAKMNINDLRYSQIE